MQKGFNVGKEKENMRKREGKYEEVVRDKIYDDENIRDLIFKGYVIPYLIDEDKFWYIQMAGE